jgi:hypothetical protein
MAMLPAATRIAVASAGAHRKTMTRAHLHLSRLIPLFSSASAFQDDLDEGASSGGGAFSDPERSGELGAAPTVYNKLPNNRDPI